MKATFGAGCFWHVEELFRTLPGVISTSVGFLGGTMNNPSYADVCTGKTGHAEVVQIDYNPDLITYEKLLETFWKNHDPTSLNRQGPDVGTQYRSAIFFHDLNQEKIATQSKNSLEMTASFDQPIVTEISPATQFYKAEDYHQQYFKKLNQ